MLGVCRWPGVASGTLHRLHLLLHLHHRHLLLPLHLHHHLLLLPQITWRLLGAGREVVKQSDGGVSHPAAR